MEAMSVGVPAIATKSGSNTEVLSDAGILIKPNNIKEMICAIKKFENDLGLRKYLSKKARDRITKYYSIKSVALNYKNIYEKLNV